MKVLITGASSYVGARIFYDLKNKYHVIGTYFNNPLSSLFIPLDATDKRAVREVVSIIKPAIIIHTANYPNTKYAIGSNENYLSLNLRSAEYLVEQANKTKAKFIFISSQAANNPDNIYGQLKLKSEKVVKTSKNGYLILRPSLMIGLSPNTMNDRPFNQILQCLDNKTKISEFDTSWKLYPSYIGHASQVIDKIIETDIWNKTIPLYIDEIVTKHQIAQDILSRFGVAVNQVDQRTNIPLSYDDLSNFTSFNLHPNSYQEMIHFVVDEIKNRDKFVV